MNLQLGANTKKNTWILVGFVALKFLLQYILISPEYDLQRDEYLHLDQAHHLAWGYQSVPPVTSWISSIIYLLGHSVFWVKFFPALFGALTLVVVWKAIAALNGNRFALVLGATAVLFSSLLRLNTLYQPNSLDVLCWTTFYYILIKYFHSEKPKWLFAAAIVFAFGFLNKYNMVFIIVGLLPALLLSRQRKVFLKKELYLAMLLAIILIAPNLLLAVQERFPGYPSFKRTGGNAIGKCGSCGFFKIPIIFLYRFLICNNFRFIWAAILPTFSKIQTFFWRVIFYPYRVSIF